MTDLSPPSRCPYCGEPVTDRKAVGRRRVYCSDSHRYADHRRQAAAAAGLGAQEFAAAVDQAITESGRAAQWLVDRTREAGHPTSAPSLSGWRSGTSVPYLTEETRDVLLSLERFLAKPTGHLLAPLERTAAALDRRGWPDPRPPRPQRPPSGPEELQRALAAEGFTNRGTMAVVEARDSLAVAADRRPARCHSVVRLCALRPGVRRYVVVMTVDHRSPVELAAVRHCQIGERRPLRRRNSRYSVLAVEFALDRELAAYEPYDVEFDTVYMPVPSQRRLPMPGWLVGITDPACRFQELELCFAGERPKEVWRCRWQQGPGRMPKPADEEPVSSADGVHELTLTNPPPGSWGFRWRWPGALEAGSAPEVPAR